MKKTALFLALMLTVGLVGCGTPKESAGTEETNGTEATKREAFSGEYVVDADYVKEKQANIILV